MLICHENPGFNFMRIVYMFQMMICCWVSASSKWQHLLGTIQSPWRWRQYLSPKTLELLTTTCFRNRKEGCHLINNICENLKTCVLATTVIILKGSGLSYDQQDHKHNAHILRASSDDYCRRYRSSNCLRRFCYQQRSVVITLFVLPIFN